MLGQPTTPGLINPTVVTQDKFWWDVQGHRHTVDTMPLDYVLNVLCFCYTHSVLRDIFNFSPLQKKLYKRLREACEAFEAAE